MKKILLLLIVLTAFSCSKEELPVEKTCDCLKRTMVKWQNSNVFEWNGAEVYYSNDCTDDGDDLGGYTGQGVEVRYIVKCK